MRYYIFLVTVIFLSSCTDTTSTQSNEKPEPATTLACRICLLTEEMKEVEKQLVLSQVNREDKDADLEKKQNSLAEKLKKLLKEYKGDPQKATTECFALYPQTHIKDQRKRDSVYLEFYNWNEFTEYPWIDTSYKPIVEDGKFLIKFRGELYRLDSNEYDKWSKRTKSLSIKIQSYKKERLTGLASLLTGLPGKKIDELCLKSVGYHSRTVFARNRNAEILRTMMDLGSSKDTVFKKLATEFYISPLEK